MLSCMTANLVTALLLVSLWVYPAVQDAPLETEKVLNNEGKDKLSLLLVASNYIGHQFPLLALGEELASRGHRVAILGPLIEGSTVLSNLSQDVGVEFIQAGFVSRRTLEIVANISKNKNVMEFLLTMFQEINKQKEEKEPNFIEQLKDGVDKLDQQDWDYIVTDFAAMAIMYYIQREWKTDKVLLNISPLTTPLGAPSPWPTPNLASGLSENMSFRDRLINALIGLTLQIVFLPLSDTLMAAGALTIEGNYFGKMGLSYPIMINTVFGFEYPNTRPPLVHYTGPLLLRFSPPLDSQLQQWLREKGKKSIVYISMGSLAELTPHIGRSIVNGIPSNYSVVWSLRESNRNILEGLKIDEKRIYIAGWVSQVTFLQHEAVAMAILHCGIGGVQEALYYKVPVICLPTGNDQYDTAARVDGRFGVRLLSSEVSQESVSDAVSKVGSGTFQENVDKVSIILRHGGGAKRAADVVEFYSEVGHQHGIPAFTKYNWSWIQYYNVDVWAVLFTVAGVGVWLSVKCLKFCLRKGCCKSKTKNKQD